MTRVRALEPHDRPDWVRMRRALWPGHDPAELADDAMLDSVACGPRVAVFVAERPGGGLCGFAEVSLRDFASGCRTHPVGYLEGWYVDPDARRSGAGRALVAAGEAWARGLGCTEMASDAYVENTLSHAAHTAIGFAETRRLVLYRKDL